MQTDMIVMVAPLFKDHLGFFQGVKSFAIEELIAQAAIEAFVIAVLPRTAGFDV